MAKKNEKIKIMIVDDHPLLRQGLKLIIEREKDFSVCAEASNANDAIKIISEKKPDIVIADISLEGNVNGIELVKAVKDRFPKALSLVLSLYDETLYAERAVRAGASGYIMKKEADVNIVKAIRTALTGELYLSDKVSKSIVRKLLQKPVDGQSEPEDILTDRELEIYMMIGSGISVREIAKKLNISLNTVETHRRHIKEKMQVKDLNELVKYAVQWVFIKNR